MSKMGPWEVKIDVSKLVEPMIMLQRKVISKVDHIITAFTRQNETKHHTFRWFFVGGRCRHNEGISVVLSAA